MPGHFAQAGCHTRATEFLGRDYQHRVVAGHGADDAFEAAAVQSRAYDVGRARRRTQHDQKTRVSHLDHPLAEHAAQMVVGRDLVLRQLRQRVRGVRHREADLHRAEVVEVA